MCVHMCVCGGGGGGGGMVQFDKLCTSLSTLQSITECIAEPEVSESEHIPLLCQLLQCVTAATRAAGDSCAQHSLRLCSVLLRIAASSYVEQFMMKVCVSSTY